MRSLLLIVALGRAASADPVPCGFMMQHAHPDGFGDILTCSGTRERAVSVRVTHQGVLTGVYITERQGKHLERNFQLYANGTVAFVVLDTSIQGGFWKQSRGTQYVVFPRGQPMSIEQVDGGLLVHDTAGHTWQLAVTKLDELRSSSVVTTIDGVSQRTTPIRFTEAGIVGVDLGRAHAFYLQHKQPNFSGIAKRTTRAYREMKSIFHDEHGATCAVPNRKLYVPNPNDPDDPSDMVFGFPEDAALATFLAKECPKLDLKPLSGALEQGGARPLEQH